MLKIGVLSIFVLIASNKWKVQVTDIKTALLQGKQIKRTVYIPPPKETNANKIKKKKKCMYGLADASRY